jgi:hypothetical protein
MYLTDELRSEIEYFKRLHSHFSIAVGKKELSITKTERRLHRHFGRSLLQTLSLITSRRVG